MSQSIAKSTAFVLAGGGSLGAVEVGMLRVLVDEGITPDFVLGASVGAINAAQPQPLRLLLEIHRHPNPEASLVIAE